MQESPFHFYYSWSDLKVIQIIRDSILYGQFIGGVLGALFAIYIQESIQLQVTFVCMWLGAAWVSIPAFIIGFVKQKKYDSESVTIHKKIIRRIIMILFFMTMTSFVFASQLYKILNI